MISNQHSQAALSNNMPKNETRKCKKKSASSHTNRDESAPLTKSNKDLQGSQGRRPSNNQCSAFTGSAQHNTLKNEKRK